MALDAGIMSVTVEFAQGLKDQDWFGKQDPYAIVRCGGQMFRTKTAVDGGKNPVWNETFAFNCINENSIDIEIKDEDGGSRDDLIGNVTFTLAKAREHGSDHIQAPVVSKKSKKQHGFISVRLNWKPNSANKAAVPAAAAAQPQMAYAAPPYGYAMPPYGAYPPAPYPGYPGAPMPMPAGYPPYQGHPPAQAAAAPQAAPATQH